MPTRTYSAVLLELHFLPSVAYFAALAAHPAVYLEQHEHYVKGSYRNRCHIAGVNGVQRLTIPLKKGKNQQQAIREVRIAYDGPWPSRHWQSIRSAYGNAPFFEHYAPHFEPFFNKKFGLLFDFNFELLMVCLRLLNLKTEIHFTENWSDTSAEGMLDLRGQFNPKQNPGSYSLHYYPQVFEDRLGYVPNLSVLDLLFCAGTEAAGILKKSWLPSRR